MPSTAISKFLKGAIRAAASRLSGTDIPEDTKTEAGKVLDAYKEKAGIGDDNADAARSATMTANRRTRTRSISARVRAIADSAPKVRGLYDLGEFAYVLMQLGWLKKDADWEKEIEGDASALPAMLADLCKAGAEAFLAMSAEEIGEFVKDVTGEEPGADVELMPVDAAMVLAATSPELARFYRGIGVARARAAAVTRAGKMLSNENEESLRSALADHETAMGQHQTAMDSHERCARAINDVLDRAVDPDSGEDEDDTEIDKSGGTSEDKGDRAVLPLTKRRREADLLRLRAA